jgi:steroid delta-isomerase-like uncharacterized protein
MSAEELKATFHRTVYAAYNQGNVDALDEIYAPEFVYHRSPFPDAVDLKAYKQVILDLRQAFTDVKLTFDQMIVEGDTAATRWTFEAKHTGQSPSFPFPATGKQVKITGTAMTHLKGGKATEEWNSVDWLGFLQQLGIIPPLG